MRASDRGNLIEENLLPFRALYYELLLKYHYLQRKMHSKTIKSPFDKSNLYTTMYIDDKNG